MSMGELAFIYSYLLVVFVVGVIARVWFVLVVIWWLVCMVGV